MTLQFPSCWTAASDIKHITELVEKRTDAFVRFRRAGGELQHIRFLLPQAPAVQDLTITFLKVVKLQCVGRVQQSAGEQEVTSQLCQ